MRKPPCSKQLFTRWPSRPHSPPHRPSRPDAHRRRLRRPRHRHDLAAGYLDCSGAFDGNNLNQDADVHRRSWPTSAPGLPARDRRHRRNDGTSGESHLRGHGLALRPGAEGRRRVQPVPVFRAGGDLDRFDTLGVGFFSGRPERRKNEHFGQGLSHATIYSRRSPRAFRSRRRMRCSPPAWRSSAGPRAAASAGSNALPQRSRPASAGLRPSSARSRAPPWRAPASRRSAARAPPGCAPSAGR